MNPIERLIAAGPPEVLEKVGWHPEDTWQWFAEEHDIQVAGMAALEWLIRQGRPPINQDYYEVTGLYDMDVQVNGPDEYRNFEALTLAEALIDAAIAVWEVSRG